MILIAGIPSEPPVKLVLDEAEKLQLPYVLFNQRHAHTYDMLLQYVNNEFSGMLQVNGKEYKLEDFTGIYLRLMDYNFLPEIKNKVFHYVGNENVIKSVSIHRQLMLWLDGADMLVINKPMDMLSNMTKAYQTQLIAECGIYIPPTLITNDTNELSEFRKRYKNVIFKSISSVRSVVKDLNKEYAQNLDNLKYLPTQFQSKLEGENIRVHVVGNETFATKISSSVTDYRYASREGKEADLKEVILPTDIHNSCIKISEVLQLPLCGIDLFHSNSNDYFCFEVNPSPAYSYYQQSTGQNIAQAIVKLLSGKNQI